MMGLADIASGLTVTERQRDRGVAVVDGTDATLEERVRPFASALPCSASDAATILETYGPGRSIERCAAAAGVEPVTAAKTLHRFGVDGISPLGPTGQRVVRDWVDARISRADALALTGASESAFALAAYVETHDPIPDAVAVANTSFERPRY